MASSRARFLNWSQLLALTALSFLMLTFQNCSQQKFLNDRDLESAALASGSDDQFQVKENEVLKTQVRSLGALQKASSEFKLLSTPRNGVVGALSKADGKFDYTPNRDFRGNDSFVFSEKISGKSDPLVRTARIVVVAVKDGPQIVSDTFQISLNSSNNPIQIVVNDRRTKDIQAWADPSYSKTQVTTQNGVLVRAGANRYLYTPNFGFRGVDTVRFYAKNSDGVTAEKEIYFNVGNPFSNLEPAMAVRGMGCMTCHAKIDSEVITDFGWGSDFFFGKSAVAGTTNSVLQLGQILIQHLICITR